MAVKKYSLENFNAGHFFEEIQSKEDFYSKKFFGGLSIYVYGRLVAFLCDKPNRQDYRGKKYKMDLWNGCLIPTSYENQKKILKLFKDSVVHPVIEKWIYLKAESRSYESNMIKLVAMIKKNEAGIGVVPEIKTRVNKKQNRKPKKKPTGSL